jgi:hypothetical protein
MTSKGLPNDQLKVLPPLKHRPKKFLAIAHVDQDNYIVNIDNINSLTGVKQKGG